MFIWPAGFAAAAINIAMLPREGFPALDDPIDHSLGRTRDRVRHRVRRSGVPLLRRQRPGISSERSIRSAAKRATEQVAARAQAELQKTGATWIATTDYRTYSMLRWYFNGRVPVIQINERGRFHGLSRSRHGSGRGSCRALCRARARQSSARYGRRPRRFRQPLERVDRSWRGIVMDTYALEKLTGWTPELSPPPDSPLFRWRVLAGDIGPAARMARLAKDRDPGPFREGS